jgi:hypothetical protein
MKLYVSVRNNRTLLASMQVGHKRKSIFCRISINVLEPQMQQKLDHLLPSPTVNQPAFDLVGRITAIPTRALYDKRVKDHHLSTLCVLAHLDGQNENGWFEVSQAEIGRFRGKSRTAITNTLRDLVSWGYVITCARRDPETNIKLPNVYRLRFDANFDKAHQRSSAKPIPDLVTAAPPLITGDDTPPHGMSFPMTNYMKYATHSDIPDTGTSSPVTYCTSYVTARNTPTWSKSLGVTHHMWYVTPSDDSLKTLKDSKDIKTRVRAQKRDYKTKNCVERETHLKSSDKIFSCTQLVNLFKDCHTRTFGPHRCPEHDRLMSEAADLVNDNLPLGLARQIIETVFERLIARGSTHAATFQVLSQTWRYIAKQWQSHGKPIDPNKWPELFATNSSDWLAFQAIFPRADSLKADATRMAFHQASRQADGGHRIIEAARQYAARKQGDEERFLKTALLWLREGHWRDDLPRNDVNTINPIEKTVNALPGINIVTTGEDESNLWDQLLDRLIVQHGCDWTDMSLWFKDCIVNIRDIVKVEAPSQFHCDQIEQRFGRYLRDALDNLCNGQRALKVVVKTN